MGRSKCNDLIIKGLNRLLLFNSPQEHCPKIQISDCIPDKKRSWNAFESCVCRRSLCWCFLSDRVCHMPHCLVLCEMQRNAVIREQRWHKILLSSLFIFSHFHYFLFFFLFIPQLYQKNADEKIVAASIYPPGSLFLARWEKESLVSWGSRYMTCTILWVLVRLNDCISSWASWYCWRYRYWQDTSAHL